MSHGDKVDRAAAGLQADGVDATLPDRRRWPTRRARFYGVQFHPEVTHTPQGAAILRALRARDLRLPRRLEHAGLHHREAVARDPRAGRQATRCILGLSGGVDSSVAAALIHRAIGDQLTCVFVDHGLLRLDEGEQVMDTFAQAPAA